MDHLLMTRDTSWPHITIPYYNCHDFGYGEFSSPWESWPERNDYRIGEELYYMASGYDDYPERLKPQLFAFVQSWLWFGLLSDFLQTPCPVDEWIVLNTDDDGGGARSNSYRVSTEKLLQVLESWCSRMNEKSVEEREKTLQRVDKLLRLARRQYFVFAFAITPIQWAEQILPEPLIMSLNVLMTTLAHTRDTCFGAAPELDINPGGDFPILKDRMARNGWCPVEIDRFHAGADIFAYYAAASMSTANTLDHSLCQGYRCSASQIDHETYETKHISADCKCHMSRNVNQDVAAILDQGRVPLVRFHTEAKEIGLCGVDLPSLCNTGYVAVSHVWSDGLGNLLHNKMPVCQLDKIQLQVAIAASDEAASTRSTSWFWIDTLCVPVGHDMTQARNTAIAQMVHIYKHAYLTLILSAELQHITLELESWEICLRINRAIWFSRLWTLHEGVISRKCAFQLKDHAVSMEDLIDRADTSNNIIGRTIRSKTRRHVSRPYASMNKFKSLSTKERCKQIWTAVQWRNTSNPEDETICLANMLELDLSPILAIDRNGPDACSKRIKAFILHQKVFPQDSPFWSVSGDLSEADEPMLADPGYRWAPISFVFRKALTFSINDETPLVKANGQGLHTMFPGFLTNMDWDSFLDLTTRTSYVNPNQMPHVREALKDPIPKIAFMVSQQWDFHYAFKFSRRFASTFQKEKLNCSMPALILERDIVREALSKDVATLTMEATYKDDRAFPDLIFSMCSALLVALQKQGASSEAVAHGTLPVDSDKNTVEHRATVVATGFVYKHMFRTSGHEAIYQIGDGCWPIRKQPKDKIGWFEPLSKDTKWCIG